ncbi:MAG: efflux RND transporter periplasmic adaptor subunit [Alphaproteobacteria bacterium]|nr:efflux RND transporter periplasmic adaptor subunit [Alphaproteobacteria bacterium]MBP7759577.1 efflux RND transporter periplasmic adaptor subunit [Alphaproteobacteria bacterium]MBP7762974.1 efflux RND transporter periplasmic adaptor subunit [Alphaproteobacteria bacterium]MBP7904217.1 efflux RND transporter periplasmic adaptor subunit [Alphaproteobacteria bacterium]
MLKLWRITRGWKLPFVAVFALCFALFSVLTRAEVPKKSPDAPPPQSGFARSVSGIGVIEPKGELVAIGTEISGLVSEVHVKAGDTVKEGAALFSLDMRDINARIDTYFSVLESARIVAADAEDKFKIFQDIRNPQSISKDEYNRAKFASEIAKSQVKQAESQYTLACVTQERMTVRAPTAGTILDVNIRPGEFASAGIVSPPLIRMGDLSSLYVRVEIDEENAGRISKDAPAEGLLRGVTDKTYPLTFVRTEPYVEPKQNLAVSGQRVDTRVLQIIYTLPTDVQGLYTGQQMDVYIEEPSDK